MEIHERIKWLRKKNEITQKELGEKLGVSTVSIRHWEAGDRGLSMTAIIALSKVFKVSTDYLLGVDDNQYPGLAGNEKILLSNYRVLDEYGRQAVDAICVVEKNRVETTKE